MSATPPPTAQPMINPRLSGEADVAIAVEDKVEEKIVTSFPVLLGWVRVWLFADSDIPVQTISLSQMTQGEILGKRWQLYTELFTLVKLQKTNKFLAKPGDKNMIESSTEAIFYTSIHCRRLEGHPLQVRHKQD